MENLPGDKPPPPNDRTAGRSYDSSPVELQKRTVEVYRQLFVTDGHLRGKDSGDGPDNDLDLSVHRSGESVCLCPADGTDSSRL